MEVLQKLLDALYEHIDRLISANQCIAAIPRTAVRKVDDLERSLCTSTNLLSILRALKVAGFWPPLETARVVNGSVNSVAEMLMNISMIKYKRADATEANGLHTLHDICNSGRQLADRVQKIIDSMENPIEKDTQIQMRRNASELETHDPRSGARRLIIEPC